MDEPNLFLSAEAALLILTVMVLTMLVNNERKNISMGLSFKTTLKFWICFKVKLQIFSSIIDL